MTLSEATVKVKPDAVVRVNAPDHETDMLKQPCRMNARNNRRRLVADGCTGISARRLPREAERWWLLLRKAGFQDSVSSCACTNSKTYSASSPFPVCVSEQKEEENDESGDTTCGVCFDTREAIVRAPCGHWVCHGCSQGVRQSTAGVLYRCPFCRAEHALTNLRCCVRLPPSVATSTQILTKARPAPLSFKR